MRNQRKQKWFGVRNAGFTLIEIMIVVALMATLMAILVRSLTGQQTEAMKDEAKLAMASIDTSLQMYRVHNHAYPTSDQGLQALVSEAAGAKNWRGPYIEASKLKDPWSNEFGYESDGTKFKITSGGADGNLGTADDVVYPEEEKQAE